MCPTTEPGSWPAGPDPELLEEACSNARLLAKLCDLLDRHRSASAAEIRGAIYAGHPELDMPIDYDPDVHGWPWEAGI